MESIASDDGVSEFDAAAPEVVTLPAHGATASAWATATECVLLLLATDGLQCAPPATTGVIEDWFLGVFRPLFVICSSPPRFSLSLSLSLTHTHTHTLSLSLTLTQSLSLSMSVFPFVKCVGLVLSAVFV
jgi:hypothetical protein